MNCVAESKTSGREMGTFYRYYSGELKAPILTLVIGGNHEASNYLQELPFGGWLAPNIYYLGYCGVVDISNDKGQVIQTIGGLSGIYNQHLPNIFYEKRCERPPYEEKIISGGKSVMSVKSVCYVRKKDTRMLESMSTGSIDIVLSHDWPRGITNYGNEFELLEFLNYGTLLEEFIENTLGSPPGMEILKKLLPSYWFAGHLHCDFEANFKGITKFLALDRCLPNSNGRFLEIITLSGVV